MRSLKEQQLSAAAAELQVQPLELEPVRREHYSQHPASTFSFSIVEFFYQKYILYTHTYMYTHVYFLDFMLSLKFVVHFHVSFQHVFTFAKNLFEHFSFQY